VLGSEFLLFAFVLAYQNKIIGDYEQCNIALTGSNTCCYRRASTNQVLDLATTSKQSKE
jgi:hypothetical protein